MQGQDVFFFCHDAEQLLSCLASRIAKMWSATSTPEKTGLARDLRVLEFLVNLSNLVRLMRIIDQKSIGDFYTEYLWTVWIPSWEHEDHGTSAC